MKHSLPARMGSLLPGRIRHEGDAVRPFEHDSYSNPPAVRGDPPPWRVPGTSLDGPARSRDCVNPPATRKNHAPIEGGEWFLAVAIHYHTDWDGDEEECDECPANPKPHMHFYERVSHFEYAFCEAHPTEREAEEALERFAKENGAADIETFTEIGGCGEGAWIAEVQPVHIRGAGDLFRLQNAWKSQK